MSAHVTSTCKSGYGIPMVSMPVLHMSCGVLLFQVHGVVHDYCSVKGLDVTMLPQQYRP